MRNRHYSEAELVAQRRQRMVDVEDALRTGMCLKDLAVMWGVSRPSVSQWCRKHLDPRDRKRLADNGAAMAGERLRKFDLPTRLEVIKMCRDAGWHWDRIGLALGVSGNALWYSTRRHASDGLEQAIEDFREEEAA